MPNIQAYQKVRALHLAHAAEITHKLLTLHVRITNCYSIKTEIRITTFVYFQLFLANYLNAPVGLRGPGNLYYSAIAPAFPAPMSAGKIKLGK